MVEDHMPPRPDCEFHFSLPHGTDTEDNGADRNEPTTESDGNEPNNMGYQDNEDSMNHLSNDPASHDTDAIGSDDAHQTTEYTFPAGFSDDDGGDESFDRSWTGRQARKAPPKQKKSPRRSDDGDGDDEASPRAKKPRKSIFGGPVKDVEEQAPDNIEDEVRSNDQDQETEDRMDEVDKDTSALDTAKPDIRQRMSSLNLDMHEKHDSRPFSLGYGIAMSDRGSQSPDPLRAASEESVVIPKMGSYEFRTINRSMPCTYLDSDKTGNYDPEQEARMKALAQRKAKAAKKAKKAGKGKAKAKEPKEHVMKCIVKLRFKAFGNVRNLTDDFERWPPGWSDVDSDYEKELREMREFRRSNTPKAERPAAKDAIEDPKGEFDDLTGHPVARGCKHCRLHDQDCSMIEGGAYPCNQCDDDEIDCVPIVTTEVKGGCVQCLEDDQNRCSFQEDPSKTVCDHCIEHEYNCEPVPPRGYKVPRVSLNIIMYGPNRKHIQCRQCRESKKRCSLKKKTDRPPCKSCKRTGIGCDFYDVAKPEPSSKAAGKQKAKLGPTDGDAPKVSKPDSEFFSPEDLEDMLMGDSDDLSREATPEIEMEDEAGNRGPLTKIITSFAHPITFNAEIPECSFCEMPAFGLCGHFAREVHVIQWHNGLGYTETGGGWVEERGLTAMCGHCTVARLQINVCPCHEYQSIDDSVPPDVMLNLLLDSQPNSLDMHHQLQRWCSLCFTPASYGCSTTQPSLEAEGDAEVNGCGLRLCATCFEKLREEHVWNMEELIRVMDVDMPKMTEEDAETDNLMGKVRADVGFLRDDGLLMRNINAGAGDEMDEQ